LPKDLLEQPKIKEALKLWPDNRKLNFEIFKVLQNSSKTNLAENDCNQKAILPILEIYQYSAVEKAINKFNDEKIKKPEIFFNKYCVQCHGGPSAFIPLPLESAEKMARYIPKFGKTGVQERLQKKIMPPIGAPFMPTDKERDEIVKIMNELKK
ncbi:MAG: cytochrome c, partial [Bdellovibrionales bacterium]|nr:cytochrome c [Bdellovibrionales bacterium]